jgi:hypothetical protein
MTSSGFEAATFRLVVQFLNRLRHRVLPGLETNIFKILNTKPKWKNHAEVPDVDDRITLYSTEISRCKEMKEVERGQD